MLLKKLNYILENLNKFDFIPVSNACVWQSSFVEKNLIWRSAVPPPEANNPVF
jgi:hypothetical protein